MTCIAGYVYDNKVYIGADSAGTSGTDITIRKDDKVFKVGEIVIGGTTSFRMLQILKYIFKPPSISQNIDEHEYMCTEFIPAVREVFKQEGFMQKDIDGEDKGGCFLVGIRGRLFTVYSDFQVSESIEPIQAVGCGQDYALSALYIYSQHLNDPRDVVLYALEVSETFSSAVQGPFKILST